MNSNYDTKTRQDLIDLIQEKDQKIAELEKQLLQHGIFIMDPERKISTDDKIRIFLDYFKCRTDIYAERFYSKRKQSFGWNPVCENNFSINCGKRDGKFNCFSCANKAFRPLTPQVLRDHFTGNSMGIGLYPMFDDSTCAFLALDFDGDQWFEDMKSVYNAALSKEIYPVMERSQSGIGGHLWFFFTDAVKAVTARRFAEYFLREAMKTNRNIPFSSFDRMFPNQDYIPADGKGNLIAAPLRYDAYLKGNSAFINDQNQLIKRPIEFLSSRKKTTSEEINLILSSEWEQDYFFEDSQIRLPLTTDIKYVRDIYGSISTSIAVKKDSLNAVTKNILCRCASMYNPKYYELQRLHKPIYIGSGFSRILSYYEEDDQFLYLPRGVLPLAQQAMPETKFHLEDLTNAGSSIDVRFTKTLRDSQQEAADSLMKYDMGILQAVPGFGKTVIALYIIAKLHVSTLILVDSKEIQDQWEKRIEEYLEYPRNKKKKDRFICKYGSSSKRLNGNIDIAMVRSLRNREDLSSLISGYGLTIIDECHHVACDSFLHVMRNVRSRYIYGLSATPRREDGLFKAITMYCGQIRKQISRKILREEYTFRQLLISRYTNHRSLKEQLTYTDMCSELMKDPARNFMIFKDIMDEFRNGSNCIILTERIEHLEVLFDMLEKSADCVYMLSGKTGRKQRQITVEELRSSAQQHILLATSKLIGEGFDLPSLNCLFLVLPISSESRITQYTGRIHRSYAGKDTVKVYDYIDTQIPMAQSMYYKRLKQYRKEGYYSYSEEDDQVIDRILFEKNTYEEQLLKDISRSESEIAIFTSSAVLSKIRKLIPLLRSTSQRGISLHFILNSSRIHNSQIIDLLAGTGGTIIFEEHNKHFIIIDRTIIWNCSFDLFSHIPDDAFATRDINPQACAEVISLISKRENNDHNSDKLF